LRSRCIEILAWEYHPGLVSDEEMAAMDTFLKECGYVLLTINGQTIYCLPEWREAVQQSAQTASGD
jgi:hypothetical protein